MTKHLQNKRDLLTIFDLKWDEVLSLIQRAAFFKEVMKNGKAVEGAAKMLQGKSVALIFEKASTRTRISFEVGVHQLGGQPLFISSRDSQMGRGEPIADTARVLSRYVSMIVLRTFAQETLEEMARHASVPVINGLSDSSHPCQVLSDLLTVAEYKVEGGWKNDATVLHEGLKRLKIAWVGDGNNVANSWIEAAGVLGLNLYLACPKEYLPGEAWLRRAREMGGRVVVTDSPTEAAANADVINTDVWASMGQEKEAASKVKAFTGFCVDSTLMKHTASGCIFMHCLPAHRGEEVTDEVIEGPSSVVWDQAENRLHMQKAIMEFLLKA